METRQPTVYIVNRGGHPYHAAADFGTLVPLTEGKINPFRPDRLAQEIASKLKHAREEDWLLLSGPDIANALAVYFMLARFPHVNLLIWSAKNRIYEPRTLEVHSLLEMISTKEE